MQIVLEGMKESIRIGELCNKYEITQAQYYKWCDMLLSSADQYTYLIRQGERTAKTRELQAKNAYRRTNS